MFFVKGALERILNNCSKFYNQGHLESLSEKTLAVC
jgi:magnesium-transporting ATPase (P-type)